MTSDKEPHGPSRAYTKDAVVVRFTVKALPPDHPDAPKGERKGRPARSPSLPPEDPKPDGPAPSSD